MKRFRLSPEAAQDIDQIWEYIAEDNLEAASRIRQALLTACRRLAQNPEMGHLRQDLTAEPVRFWPVYSYLVIYNPVKRPLEIVRVVHGARDVPGLLG